MNPDEPISLYVPARNAEPILAACIDAIRAQSRPPDELFIVVDPRSQDRTVDAARGLGVPVLEQTGATLGAARNQAIRAARHRWLASCDSDVLIEPDWLARLAERRDSQAAGIGGRTLEHIRNPFDDWRSIQMPHHWGGHGLRNPFMLVSEVLFDREALLAVGGYRDDLNYYEDSDLCQRLRDAGYDLWYEPAAVAHHQRSDSLAGLLDLRWKYSEYRQKHLLDRYGDLGRKTEVNREYALGTLSRLLARSREDLAYISFLLYFHHLLMDLRSLHSRRPLLDPAFRAASEADTLATACRTLAAHTARLAEQVHRDLEPRLAVPAAAGASPVPRSWPAHLERIARAVDAFCRDLGSDVLGVIADSADLLAGRQTARPHLHRRSTEALQEVLEAMPTQMFSSSELASVVQAARHEWPGLTRLEATGSATPGEQEHIRQAIPGEAAGPRDCVAGIALHLEGMAAPLDAFAELSRRYQRLVTCYQPPAGFIPGLDVPSAADFASAAAAAGWDIRRFDTLVGRTRLILQKQESPDSRGLAIERAGE